MRGTAAKGWIELGREKLDNTKRKALDLCIHKTNHRPHKTKKQSIVQFTCTTYAKMQAIVLSYARRGYKTSDRCFSVDMEWAYRLTHHDFDGKSSEDASTIMGLTQRRVQQLLQQLHFIAPQLFQVSGSNERIFKALFSWESLPKNIRQSVDKGSWGI